MEEAAENLLVQFSVLRFVIMAILAVVLSVILTTRLNRDFELLKSSSAAACELAPAGAPVGITPLELDDELRAMSILIRWAQACRPRPSSESRSSLKWARYSSSNGRRLPSSRRSTTSTS